MTRILTVVCLIFSAIGCAAQTKISSRLSAVATTEDLTWSIAGNQNGTKPNVLSELQWTNVMGYGVGVGFTLPIRDRWAVSVDGEVLGYVKGTVFDTDYQRDNRTNPSFQATEDANKGFSYRLLPVVGFRVIDTRTVDVTAGAGFLVSSKRFYLVNHAADLNSWYHATWRGGSVFGELSVDVGFCELQFRSDYAQVGYRATADWNLIDSFEHPVSFRHRANGFLLSNTFSVAKSISERVQAVLVFSHCYSSTGAGIDTLYKTDGTTPITRLNDVTGQGVSFGLGVKYGF